MTGIYIHWPFCSGFCIYCDFYSENCSGRMAEYTEALSREIQARKGFFDASSKPRTLYFGGGTPSLVPPALLETAVGRVSSVFGVSGFEEFTLEANPDDVTPDRLAAWRAMGVNRLSMGVQSFCDSHLKWMRRRHDSAEAENAFLMAREAGFDNISTDLIFGYAGLSMQEWEESIRRTIGLRPEHVSCYQMSIESGSSLGEMASRGEYAEPPQEICAEQYALLQRLLGEAGYLQYEISNFALPGRESRHNSIYWEGGAYLGLGAAAHSYDGNRTRSWNIADLEKYISAGAENVTVETLSDKDLANEKVMLSLRTAKGLEPSLIPHGNRPLADRMLRSGELEMAEGCLRIPASRFFVSDDIMSRLFC